MAGTAAGLTALRAALLLRCQVARDTRQRSATARASQARAAAVAAHDAAAARAAAFEAVRQGDMRRAIDALSKEPVGGGMMHILPALQIRRQDEADALADAANAAAARRKEAEAAEVASLAVLAAVARKTQRREKLAAAMSERHHAALALAQEAEREDAITGGFRSVA